MIDEETLWAINILHERLQKLEPPQVPLSGAELLGRWIEEQWDRIEDESIKDQLIERGAK